MPGSSETAVAVGGRAECTVDLDAIRHNVGVIRGRLASETQLWAVVKADAYGHGVAQVSEAVVAAGVERLCVATLSEAWQLRRLGPLDAGSMRRARELDVAVTITGQAMLEHLSALAESMSVAPGVTLDDRGAVERPLAVHLKVDTGMGRWGVPLEQVSSALETIVACSGVQLQGIMTHCAVADEPGSRFTSEQIARFSEVVELARQQNPHVIAHAANSAATFGFPDAHFDAVRCGIALYGMAPDQGRPEAIGLRPALSLRSHVAEIRELQPGDSVGYGRTFIAQRPVRIAEIPVGYADGVRRLLSNRAQALVRGVRSRYAGTISMDHLALMVDDDVAVGDEVVLIGPSGDDRITAEELAGQCGTINYEITCGIAVEPRLRRTWVNP